MKDFRHLKTEQQKEGKGYVILLAIVLLLIASADALADLAVKLL
jgi:hypothetical protein